MKIDIKGAIIPSNDKWIYDYLELDATSPKDINNALDKANGQAVEVYINSGGGDIFAGSEIYTSLKMYKGDCKIHIVGMAGSSASIIAMARESDISPVGQIMVHNVSSNAGGDYHDMDKMSEILKNANRALCQAYVYKTGMSEQEALAMMDKETWLTAQQAVELKLVNNIMFDKPPQLINSCNSEILPIAVINKIRNTVKNPFSNNETDIFMKQKAIAKLKLLNLKGR